MERHEDAQAIKAWLTKKRDSGLAHGKYTLGEAAVINDLLADLHSSIAQGKLPWEVDNAA